MAAAIIVDEPTLLKLAHEMAHSRTSGASHLRQVFLMDSSQHRRVLPIHGGGHVGQAQKNTGETFFASACDVIHQIFFILSIAREQTLKEDVANLRLLREKAF